jgi:hypothetical protein
MKMHDAMHVCVGINACAGRGVHAAKLLRQEDCGVHPPVRQVDAQTMFISVTTRTPVPLLDARARLGTRYGMRVREACCCLAVVCRNKQWQARNMGVMNSFAAACQDRLVCVTCLAATAMVACVLPLSRISLTLQQTART